MSALEAQPLPSHDPARELTGGAAPAVQEESAFTVTLRERINVVYGGPFIRVFYATCLVLTVLLIGWTANAHAGGGDTRPWWVRALEAILTFLFAAELGVRVYAHPLGIRQSRVVAAEAVLSALCLFAWLLSELLPATGALDLDEVDDALLGVRYAAQTVRVLYYMRMQWLEGRQRASVVDFSGVSASPPAGRRADEKNGLLDPQAATELSPGGGGLDPGLDPNGVDRWHGRDASQWQLPVGLDEPVEAELGADGRLGGTGTGLVGAYDDDELQIPSVAGGFPPPTLSPPTRPSALPPPPAPSRGAEV